MHSFTGHERPGSTCLPQVYLCVLDRACSPFKFKRDCSREHGKQASANLTKHQLWFCIMQEGSIRLFPVVSAGWLQKHHQNNASLSAHGCASGQAYTEPKAVVLHVQSDRHTEQLVFGHTSDKTRGPNKRPRGVWEEAYLLDAHHRPSTQDLTEKQGLLNSD